MPGQHARATVLLQLLARCKIDDCSDATLFLLKKRWS